MTARVFIGTEPRMWRGTRVLEYSLEKCASIDVDIHRMDYSLDDDTWHDWRIGRPHGVPATRNTNPETGELVWFTDFTCFRWAIPEKCGFQGRAIYNDVDQIYLGDVKELLELDMGDAALLSLTTNETSVMLMDCEKFANLDWWPSIQEMKDSNWGIQHYIQLLRRNEMYGQLPTNWNCLDGQFYSPGWTKLVHYTDMSGQLWRPYPERLNYRRHRVPEMEELWMNLYFEAVDNGYLTEDDCPELGQPPGGDAFIPFVKLWLHEKGLVWDEDGPNLV
jgi:hypothetical protein